MIIHRNNSPRSPNRVVVVGSNSFVGKACLRRLENKTIPVVRISRREVDLQSDDASEKLALAFRPDDVILLVAAIAPCKDPEMLIENMKLIRNIQTALQRSPVSHVVNVSSDAVYRDSPEPIKEESCAEPGSLHGVMHLARELVLKELNLPLVSVRPTLIYGAEDPHDGYGPNRFRRLAEEGKEIVLFGEGEERRDHVWVEDVAEIVCRCILHRSVGVINAVSGTVISFREAAEIVLSHFQRPPAIKGSLRRGPMPHGGYRPFDNSATKRAFPDFEYTAPTEGLAKVHHQLYGIKT